MPQSSIASRKRRTPRLSAELKRLIREQREDQRQDRTGLRSMMAQEFLRA